MLLIFFSTFNIIGTFQRFNRYPLIIDPSGQATEFIMREYRERKITKTSFLDDSFRKNLESALRFGNPLLVQVNYCDFTFLLVFLQFLLFAIVKTVKHFKFQNPQSTRTYKMLRLRQRLAFSSDTSDISYAFLNCKVMSTFWSKY